MYRPNGSNRLAALVLAAAIAAPALAVPPPIVVNSAADTVANDGFCTLREAINSANTDAASGNMAGECAAGSAAPAVDTIEFSIPASDANCVGTPKICTIKPTATLDVTSPVFINGYTQVDTSTATSAHANTLAVGDDAVLLVQIDASSVGGTLFNLHGVFGTPNAGASGSTISGLVISHFAAGVAICISCAFGVDASNVKITGNFLGTNVAGTAVTSSSTAIASETSSGMIIGGSAPADRNVIATTSEAINLNACSNGVIQGNYIGVNAAGAAALSVSSGIHLVQGSSGHQIGGSGSGAGNVIAGHTFGGIWIEGNGSGGNVIQGNRIGTDATGTVALGAASGILFGGTGSGNQIGGAAAGEGNIISGNGNDGIKIVDAPVGALIQGNKIGTDISGRLPIPNGWCGIDVSGSASSTAGTIGGIGAGAANVIAFNGTNGVGMYSPNAGWGIRGNSIFSNGSLGISLQGRCDDFSSAAAANDTNDVDTGANDLQNYPVITTLAIDNAGTHAAVSGTLNSLANQTFHLDFYANAGCDGSNPDSATASRHGEGKIYLGSTDVATTGNDATFGVLDFGLPHDRHVITATATAPDGSTSEFSACSSEDTIFSDDIEGD